MFYKDLSWTQQTRSAKKKLHMEASIGLIATILMVAKIYV